MLTYFCSFRIWPKSVGILFKKPKRNKNIKITHHLVIIVRNKRFIWLKEIIQVVRHIISLSSLLLLLMFWRLQTIRNNWLRDLLLLIKRQLMLTQRWIVESWPRNICSGRVHPPRSFIRLLWSETKIIRFYSQTFLEGFYKENPNRDR